MKILAVFIILGCLAAAIAYGLDAETKEIMVNVYNISRDQYALIVSMLDDLSNSVIQSDLAETKINEWKEQYGEKIKDAPAETRKMVDLTKRMIEITREIVSDYEPLNQRTKDLLGELEEVKTELKSVMTEIRYMVK